jgi:hypothetical protein
LPLYCSFIALTNGVIVENGMEHSALAIHAEFRLWLVRCCQKLPTLPREGPILSSEDMRDTQNRAQKIRTIQISFDCRAHPTRTQTGTPAHTFGAPRGTASLVTLCRADFFFFSLFVFLAA